MGRKALSQEQILSRFKQIHKEKYLYNKVLFHKMNEKVIVTCPLHGDFLITPSKHCIGQGCSKCGLIKRSQSQSMTDEEYINKCKNVHNSKYAYNKTHTNGNLHNKVTIICQKHGEFEQIAQEHLNGHGCPLCAIENRKITTEELIYRGNKIHGNKYIYEKTIANGYKNEIVITCPLHGDFKQTVESHLKGSGCPLCRQSHLESEVKQFLENNKIDFIQQKSFDWLKDKKKLHLDFYLPSYKLAIECQGEQHFKTCEYFGGEEKYLDTVRKDELKFKLCEDHNIKLLYFTHCNYPYNHSLITSLEDLKEAILQ